MPATFYLNEGAKKGPAVYVRVSHSHDPGVVSDRLATDADKARFPREWARYEDSLKSAAEPKASRRKASSKRKKAA